MSLLNDRFSPTANRVFDPQQVAKVKAHSNNHRALKTQKAKRPASYQRMYHERALGLLSSGERGLIQKFMAADGSTTTSIARLQPGPKKQAYAHYGRVMGDVVEHFKKRKTEKDVFLVSIPIFIWLQPDLSFMEKHLLADVWHFQQSERGCFRSNGSFALELGTTEGNAKDAIYRLRYAGFLDEYEGKKGERKLRLSKEFLKLVGLTGSSVPTDQHVSGHLPDGQCPLTNMSVPTDQEKAQNLNDTRMDIDDFEQDKTHILQGVLKDRQRQRKMPSSLSSKSSASRAGASPPAPPQAAGLKLSMKEIVQLPDSKRRAIKFVMAHRLIANLCFPIRTPIVSQPEIEILEKFFQDNPDHPASALLLLQIKAWGLIGARAKNSNGETYRYGVCQNSKDIQHVLGHLDGIVRDTNLAEIYDLHVKEIIVQFGLELKAQLEASYDPEELQTTLVALETKLNEIFNTQLEQSAGS